jgi:hypothetical protein
MPGWDDTFIELLGGLKEGFRKERDDSRLLYNYK